MESHVHTSPVSEKSNLHLGADFRLCGWIVFGFLAEDS